MRDTIEMAREAGAIHIHGKPKEFAIVGNDNIKAFEALVRADEREACAKVCDEVAKNYGDVAEGPFVTDFGKHTHMSMAAGARNCLAAIRARGETK
jgi:hypothetical protein